MIAANAMCAGGRIKRPPKQVRPVHGDEGAMATLADPPATRRRVGGSATAGASMYTSEANLLTMSTTMTIRLEDEMRARLDRLAASTQRSKSYLAAEAVRQYVESNEWQIAEIEAALAEADGGDFADDRDVEAVTAKWAADAR